jgi:hypothetical protein
MRYQEDVHLAYEFDRMIAPLQNESNSIPIVFVGKLRASNRFEKNFLEGEIAGRSFFGLQGGWTSSTGDGLAFMRSIGINYAAPNEQAMNKALEFWKDMPSYPKEGCIIKTQVDIAISKEVAEIVKQAGQEVTELPDDVFVAKADIIIIKLSDDLTAM